MKPLLCASALLALLLPWPSGRSQEHEEPESELARNMEAIEDTVKLLRKHLKDETMRPQALDALSEIQRLSLACKGLVPGAAAELPEAERATLVTAFRRTMVDFLTRQLELEAALLDGDAEAAKSAFDRFRAMEDSAHERFAPEDG
jgi:hypothetical protein